MAINTTPMTREQVEALADQIARLSLRVDIAKHSMLTHLRTFDAQNVWANLGFISAAAWLAWRTEMGTATAREHVRVARALGELLLVDAAFAAGKLSYAKVRAITRVATPATEQDFIDVAMHATASQIEKIAAAYRRVRVDPSEPTMDLRRFMRRSDTRSGMVRIELQLPPEQANVVWEAMSAALETGGAARSRTLPRRRRTLSQGRGPRLRPGPSAFPQKRPLEERPWKPSERTHW